MSALSSGEPGGYHRKRARTRRRLLDAGLVEIGLHGLNGITVSAIAERAEMATGTFYNHFDDLPTFFALIADEVASSVAQTSDYLAQQGFVAAERLLIGSLMVVQAQRRDRNQRWAFARLTTSIPELRRSARDTARSNLVGAIVDGHVDIDVASIEIVVESVLGSIVAWTMAIARSDHSDNVALAPYLATLLRLINATPEFTEAAMTKIGSGEVVPNALRFDPSALGTAFYADRHDRRPS